MGNRTKPAICQRHEQSRGQKKSETESETGLEVRLSNRVPGLRVHLVAFFGSLLLALIPLSAVHWSQNDIKNSCKTVPKPTFCNRSNQFYVDCDRTEVARDLIC